MKKGSVWYEFSWQGEDTATGHVSFKRSKNILFGRLSHGETIYMIENCGNNCNAVYEIDVNYFNQMID